MTKTNRPAAAIFAAVMLALLWVPTLTMPVTANSSAFRIAELA